MKKPNKRVQLTALILVFALPMIAAWVLFYFHDYFGSATVNHGTLMTPLVRTMADTTHRWQVVYVPRGGRGKSCADTTHELKQMVKLLGEKQRRVITLCKPALEHLPKGRIYLVDPLGNIFMYYASSADPVDIYKDLKHLLNISQIG